MITGGTRRTISDQRSISIQSIQDAVAKVFHVSRAELLSPSRRQHIAYARHIAMYLSRELAGRIEDSATNCSLGFVSKGGVSFPRIAIAFCRDHSSVIHACNAIERRRKFDTAFARMLQSLAREIGSHHSRNLVEAA
jgi:chromosomal replication initiator protein